MTLCKKFVAVIKIKWRLRLRGVQQSFLSVLVLISTLVAGDLRAQTSTLKEYEMKASFLYNFMKYVDWPRAGKLETTNVATIGLLGENPFGNAFSVLENKTVNGRRLIVKRIERPEDAAQCQIVFISSSEKNRLPQILETVKTLSVLTVGETEGFADRGGIINLIAEKNNIRLEINPQAAGNAGLTISSQLLKLPKVRIVRG